MVSVTTELYLVFVDFKYENTDPHKYVDPKQK